MPAFTQMIRGIAPEKFGEIFSASSRKARETYFHRLGIRKAKQSNRLARLAAHAEARTLSLWEALRERDDDEMVREVLQTWLLTKRALLADALDHMGIEHEDGLTDAEDLDERFEKLSGKDLEGLVASLRAKQHDAVEIALYLKFMGADPDKVDAAL